MGKSVKADGGTLKNFLILLMTYTTTEQENFPNRFDLLPHTHCYFA